MRPFFWALMSLVWENSDQELYPTVEDLVVHVKIATGHRRHLIFEGGEIAYVPESIAFHNMDQTAFDAFFERVCNWVAEKVLPGVTHEDLRRELEEMTGARIGA